MTKYAENLLSLRSRLLPSPVLRVLGSVAIGVVFTLVISPLDLVGLLFPFAVVVCIASVWVGAGNKARGLRGNYYSPMRPDSETSVLEGGKVPLPRRWWTIWDRWLPLVLVAVSFLVSNVVNAIDSPVFGWTIAVIAGVLITGGTAWWWTSASDRPAGQPSFASLVTRSPRWKPAGDASAVAAVLYAVNACPKGRQIRRDALDSTAAGIFALEEGAVSNALAELSERREVLVAAERDRDSVRQDWISLTPAGIESVVASFRRDAAHA